MLRTFSQHQVRPTMDLDGMWDFTVAPDRKSQAGLPKRYPRTICVPSAWEQMPGLENYRGKAWLRRTIPGGGGAVRLCFGGVSHTGTVYVDGKRIGTHYDAYTPWDALVPALGAGEHELVVEVDNSYGPHSALHRHEDYYTYGGIIRPVEIQQVPALFIDKVFAVPARRGKTWDLEVRVRLRNWSRQTVRRRVVVDLASSRLDMGRVSVAAGATREFRASLRGLDVAAWSPAAPMLYHLTVQLLDGEKVEDDLIDRVGFREVKVRGKSILLNGKPLRLRGYCRHEDHALFGSALPLQAMVYDLNLLADLGCNFIRTSHYPNDMRFLDLCDELGFCVWEESHGYSVDFRHPLVREQLRRETTEMVEWHHNHPAIIIWASLNECDSASPLGCRMHKYILGLIRRLDSSRLVTYASNRAENDRCYHLADVVAWNRYDAWYRGLPDSIEPTIKGLLKWLHSSPRIGGKGKPVIMSESGGAALYGWRHPHHAKWTEEYQAELLDETLRVYLNHPDIAGVSLWQFCDVRISSDQAIKSGWTMRPRTMNNKGTVDEYRRRKLSYESVKRRMHEAAAKWD